ncbi:mitochondrial S-adenosylmethionine carrier protein isoform X5 [Mus musculus]|uniref:mitochondrial S-adenosylmethionine carrier protein isoform X5 n=1 Tax=Mus musculus TaxID=10090 RepID=UPI0005AB952A|nr:S-adenosylmethionine mitochondrial carrier protein isoform X5 [Mus musculus]|eukprot:XP_011239748.1 PREDICTED: S-adenosylmethionine mitochondrial carrier protein isoform X5 [Mus musculus]
MDAPGFTASLVAGGVAGVSVDLILFPLDTIKTRLQSPQGFNKAGGFRGIYAGVPSAAVGSFPNAAAFFLTYEYVKSLLHTDSTSHFKPVKHMLAASTGEVMCAGTCGYESQERALDSSELACCVAAGILPLVLLIVHQTFLTAEPSPALVCCVNFRINLYISARYQRGITVDSIH